VRGSVHRRLFAFGEHRFCDRPTGGDHGSRVASCDGCKSVDSNLRGSLTTARMVSRSAWA
jgi:hypothetical protein